MTQLTLQVDPLADAVAWAIQNREAYRFLVSLTRQDIEAGVRPSMDAYGHVLRRPHIAGLLGLRRMSAPVLFNNSLTSNLARLIMREHPDLAGAFETRDSWAERGGKPKEGAA